MRTDGLDVVSIGAAVQLAKKKLLPKMTAADAGEQLIVGPDGKVALGTPVTATIAVNNHVLTVTEAAEEG